ncbi:MAG: DUF4861 domain-containing protein [Cytophagaceae bacterium]|nr:DUF4861 domain-containing protein [Cytophagaceae bacterium]
MESKAFVKFWPYWLLVIFFAQVSGAQDLSFWIEHKSSKTFGQVIIAIPRSEMQAHAPGMDLEYIGIKEVGKSWSIFQLDDLDHDGAWDEALVALHLDPHEIKPMQVSCVSKQEFLKITEVEKLTNIHLGKSENKDGKYKEVLHEIRPASHLPQARPMLYQFEGIGWESERVAFRSYFDARNGKDIFGKCSAGILLDSIGLPGKDYHELQSWGMDVLKVGTSLGAGALAIRYRGRYYRLGATDSAIFTVLQEGPLRSRFQIQYAGWKVSDKSLQLIETITIEAGSYGYNSTVQVKGLSSDSFEIVTGIVNLKNQKKKFHEFSTPTAAFLFSWADQSENHDRLGMALLSPSSCKPWINVSSDQATSDEDITHTFFWHLKPDQQASATFYFFALWEKSDPAFHSFSLQKKWLINEARRQFEKPAIRWKP